MTYDRHFAAGQFGFNYSGGDTIDYLGRFGLKIPFDVDSFGHGAQNLKEYYDFGAAEVLFNFNHREISVANMTRQLGTTFAAAGAGNPTDIFVPDESGVVSAVTHKIVAANAPIAGSVSIHGIIGGIDTWLVPSSGAPAAGEYQITGSDILFNTAQDGVTMHFSYAYASTTVGVAAATFPTSFIPAAVSGYGFVRLGPQNATRNSMLVFKVVNLVRAGGEFNLDVEHNKISTGMDLAYAFTTSSTLKLSVI